MTEDFFCLQGTMPHIKKQDVFFESLPRGLEDKTLLMASDIHYGGLLTSERMTRMIDEMLSLNADMIMLCGDYADEIVNETDFLKKHLPRLRAPLGVYCVPGNNDWEAVDGDYGKVESLFADAGATFLVNSSTFTNVDGGRLVVSGVDDYKNGKPNNKGFVKDIREGDFCVLLSHSPSALDSILPGSYARFQLVLCGHTHAGQISVGGLSLYTLGFEKESLFSRRKYFFVKGIHDVDGMKVVVSSGIGCSILPIRVGAPPEIHLFTLKRQL